jgi:hypothetical protein
LATSLRDGTKEREAKTTEEEEEEEEEEKEGRIQFLLGWTAGFAWRRRRANRT